MTHIAYRIDLISRSLSRTEGRRHWVLPPSKDLGMLMNSPATAMVQCRFVRLTGFLKRAAIPMAFRAHSTSSCGCSKTSGGTS